MRDYSSVSPQFWIGKTGKSLRGNLEAQLLALYLMTCPHANMIGVFHCPLVYMAHETGLPFEGASKGLRSLINAGFCQYDDETEEVFVVRMAAFQIGEGLDAKDNRCKSTAREYEKIQSALMRSAFFATYSVAFNLPGRVEKLSPFEAPSKPLRSQEQEQEQDKDQDKEQEHALNTPRPRPVDNSVGMPNPQARADSKKIPKPETPAALACKALHAAGLSGVSVSHPELVALVNRGATPAMFTDAATKAIAKGKDFRYVVGTLQGQIEDAVAMGSGPAIGAAAWDADRPSIEAMGVRLDLGPWCGNAAQELFSVYADRVRLAVVEQGVEV